jgi:hypothetical protein
MFLILIKFKKKLTKKSLQDSIKKKLYNIIY